MGMRDYQNLKDIIVSEAQEKIMDIFCAAWDDCRNMGHCEDCPHCGAKMDEEEKHETD